MAPSTTIQSYPQDGSAKATRFADSELILVCTRNSSLKRRCRAPRCLNARGPTRFCFVQRMAAPSLIRSSPVLFGSIRRNHCAIPLLISRGDHETKFYPLRLPDSHGDRLHRSRLRPGRQDKPCLLCCVELPVTKAASSSTRHQRPTRQTSRLRATRSTRPAPRRKPP